MREGSPASIHSVSSLAIEDVFVATASKTNLVCLLCNHLDPPTRLCWLAICQDIQQDIRAVLLLQAVRHGVSCSVPLCHKRSDGASLKPRRSANCSTPP